VTLTSRQVRALLDQHGLRPSRALGQNFVVDPNTVRRIARLAAVAPGDRVIEIGAGLGSLTLALAEVAREVVAVEVDGHLVPVLRDVVADRNVRVVEGDARTLDWSEVLGDAAPWSLVANLPYNVATPIVLDLLAGVPAIERMLVMVQREVAERLAAGAGDAAYGIPSVKRAWWASAAIVGTVPPTVFVPRPKVESALVRITRCAEPTDVDRARVFALIDAGFGQRRKMLRRALADHVPEGALARAGIDPAARAEQLALDDWVRLAVASPAAPVTPSAS
jgi:16S rRNA (adenine1518-N6/adenine1519-N6)-dimethyltransferase